MKSCPLVKGKSKVELCSGSDTQFHRDPAVGRRLKQFSAVKMSSLEVRERRCKTSAWRLNTPNLHPETTVSLSRAQGKPTVLRRQPEALTTPPWTCADINFSPRTDFTFVFLTV